MTTERRTRVPFSGHRTKLQLSPEDLQGFKDRDEVPRWFSDVDGRVQQAEAGGYTFALPEEARSIGRFSLNKGNSDLSDRVSRVVSKGGGEEVIGVLMKIKKEYYDEDQAAKELRNQAIDVMLNRNKAGDAGGAGVESAYVPGGTTIPR